MRGLFIVLMLSFASMTYAQDSDGERLVQGCNELIGIYKNKKEKRLLASQLVSSSDAMLAGYCMGVVKMVSNYASNSCDGKNWYQLAEHIAAEWSVKTQKLDIGDSLNKVCRGW